jgi:hypothetical protein
MILIAVCITKKNAMLNMCRERKWQIRETLLLANQKIFNQALLFISNNACTYLTRIEVQGTPRFKSKKFMTTTYVRKGRKKNETQDKGGL